MAPRSEVLGNGAIRREEALRLPGRLAPLHASLALACGLVGVLRPIVERAVLAMFHAWEALALGRAVAFAFIGDDHAWDILAALEERAEELLGGVLVAPPLHQDVELYAILIHCPPQIMPFLIDRAEHFIQMPRIPWPGTPVTKGMRIGLAELATPRADGFVGHDHATDEQELFPITVAEREAEIPPDRVADDLSWEPMMFVGVG
jgi:hypothetical protein